MINLNSKSLSSCIIFVVILLCCSFNPITCAPSKNMGIISSIKEISSNSTDLQKVLSDMKRSINRHRYYYLNAFESIPENEYKLNFPLFDFKVLEAKQHSSLLNLDGYNNYRGRVVVKGQNGQSYATFGDVTIGNTFELLLQVDVSAPYTYTFSTPSFSPSPLLYHTDCTYIKTKILKDHNGLMSISEFICFNQHPTTFKDKALDKNYFTYTSTSSAQQHQTAATTNPDDSPKKVTWVSLNHTISVMSYNLWNYNTPWRVRKELLADIIAKESPDIIAFQEARYSAWAGEYKFDQYPALYGQERNQVQHISQALSLRNQKYHFTYLPSMVYPNNNQLQYEGLAIFSKHPILDVSSIKLSRDNSDKEDEHQRSCLRVQTFFQPANLAINVFTSHFSLSSAGSQRNAYEVYEYMSQFQKPYVFTGDLNALPSSDAIRFLSANSVYGTAQIQGKKADLVDTWYYFKNNPLMNSKVVQQQQNNNNLNMNNNLNDILCVNSDNINGYTFPTLDGFPSKRIDYIFKSDDKILDVIDFKFLGSCSKDSIYPSDHSSIVTTFSINRLT